MKALIKSMIKNEGNIYRFIINKNINHLYSFIEGLLYCGEMYGKLSKEEKLFQDNFNKWVCSYYNKIDLDAKWNNLILYRNFNSTEQALYEFFKLYKQWYKEEFGEDAW